MIIIFAVFAVICLVFIAYLLNKKWELENKVKYTKKTATELLGENFSLFMENNKLQSKLAFAGKNYIEMKNKLNEEITLLKTKINDKNNSKKKARQTVESKNKRSRKLPGMRKKGVS